MNTAQVKVDIVETGRAIIVAGDHQAYVGRDGGRFYVEDDATGAVLGYVRSYRRAGELARDAWGLSGHTVVVDDERNY